MYSDALACAHGLRVREPSTNLTLPTAVLAETVQAW